MNVGYLGVDVNYRALLVFGSCLFFLNVPLSAESHDSTGRIRRAFAETPVSYGLGGLASNCNVTRPPDPLPPQVDRGGIEQPQANVDRGDGTDVEGLRPPNKPPGTVPEAGSGSVTSTNAGTSAGGKAIPSSGSTADEAGPVSRKGSADAGDETRPLTELDHKMASFFDRQCLSCHGPTAEGAPRLFKSDGHLKNTASSKHIAEVLEGKHLSDVGTMKQFIPKMHDRLSDDERSLIEDWAKENGQIIDLPRPRRSDRAELDVVNHWPKPPESLEDLFGPGKYEREDLIKIEKLAEKLDDAKRAGRKPPRIFNIGMTDVNLTPETIKVPGVQDPLSREELENLDRAFADAKAHPDEEVVIYCGCCGTEGCSYTLYAAWLVKTRYGLKNVRIVDFPASESLLLPAGLEKWEKSKRDAEAR